MENKEKKQMLTTELTKEKGGRDCRDDSGYVNKRNQTTGRFRTEPAARSSSGACIHISRTK